MNCDKRDLLLYAVTDRTWLGEKKLAEAVRESLEGGVTCVQLREKELEETCFLEQARLLKKLCQLYHVPFLVNDNVEIALMADADGAHIGQSDMEVWRARQLLGADKILGVSAQTVEQALQAQQQGADYLGVGAVFPTGSKADAVEVSRDTLKKICEAVSIPVVAIGGITAENVGQLSGSGICGAAVISAIFAQGDIREAAKRLRTAVEAAVQL